MAPCSPLTLMAQVLLTCIVSRRLRMLTTTVMEVFQRQDELSGNTLYGTTLGGGTNGFGTVFAINTDGTCFTLLHSFSFLDGAGPQAGLILTGNTLYGTTSDGCNAIFTDPHNYPLSGSGTVFSISLPPPQLTITLSGVNVILRGRRMRQVHFAIHNQSRSADNLDSCGWAEYSDQSYFWHKTVFTV